MLGELFDGLLCGDVEALGEVVEGIVAGEVITREALEALPGRDRQAVR